MLSTNSVTLLQLITFYSEIICRESWSLSYLESNHS